MLKKGLLSVLFIALFACNDGDIFEVNLDFPEALTYCEGNSDLIIYKIKESPYESLSAKLPSSSLSNLTTMGDFSVPLSSTNTFNYRTYDGDPSAIFCNSLPPSNPTITNDSQSTSGDVIFSTALVEDDNDGIPANLEDINGDGDLENDDTDGDGIPNYKDSDDDGDNIPTANENPDPNNDNDPSDALDTDGDNTPNYLDADDDNDGVITRYEDTNGDNDPSNDITNPTIGPDYLNNLITVSTVNDVYRDHTKNQTFTCIITIENMTLINSSTNEILISEDYFFGTIITEQTNVSFEVPFN